MTVTASWVAANWSVTSHQSWSGVCEGWVMEGGGDGGPTKEADWWKHSKLRLLAAALPLPFRLSRRRGGGGGVAVVTEEATSCSPEAFCTAHLEGAANQSTQSQDRQEVTSPPLLKPVRFL